MSFSEEVSSSLEPAHSFGVSGDSAEDLIFSSSVGLFSYEVPNNDSSPMFSHEDLTSGSVLIQNPTSFSHKFGLVEYVVFVSVLVFSASIGLFYAFCGKGQKSTEEYLMGNRKMSVLPVSLSLLCRLRQKNEL